MPELPDTIDGVLDALSSVIDDSRGESSRLGYFAAMYRTVTATVQQGIEEDFFDDGARMERLDVAFANRYLDALWAFQQGEPCTGSWQVACGAAGHWRPAILQHLLVGISAHINLDLGVAAAEVSPGDQLPGLRRDFDRINQILASLIRQILDDLDDVSPAIGLLDRLGGRTDDEIARFSIEVARTQAWRFAADLAPLDRAAWAGPIQARDARVAAFGRRLLTPGLLTAPMLVIRGLERAPVPHVIDVLSRSAPPDLDDLDVATGP